MRIVFLDFDGVLNGDGFLDRDRISDEGGDWTRWWLDWIDPACVGHLNALTDRTGAGLVLSSSRRSWAALEDVARIFKDAGIRGELVGATPYLRGEDRGTEIRQWLAETAIEVESYAILDDSDDMGALAGRLVLVDPATGLTEGDAGRAAEMLEGTRPWTAGPAPPR